MIRDIEGGTRRRETETNTHLMMLTIINNDDISSAGLLVTISNYNDDKYKAADDDNGNQDENYIEQYIATTTRQQPKIRNCKILTHDSKNCENNGVGLRRSIDANDNGQINAETTHEWRLFHSRQQQNNRGYWLPHSTKTDHDRVACVKTFSVLTKKY